MRIAFIGHDALANIPMALLEHGHQLTHIFEAGPTNSAVDVRMRDVARRSGVVLAHRLVQRSDLEAIHAATPDFILCAGYPRRLPVLPGDPVPAVNMHPSPLPEGRGPRPFEWAILTGRAATGVTFHEIVERFDAGPIVYQQPLPLLPNETTISLEFRTRQMAETMAVELAANFSHYWATRWPQGSGSYCRVPRKHDRTLNLEGSVVQIERQLRAFAPGGLYVRLHGKEWVVFDAVCWPETHAHQPGTIVARNGTAMLVAVSDGYLYMTNSMSPIESRVRGSLRSVRRLLP